MKPAFLILLLWLLTQPAVGQAVFRMDSLPVNGVVLDKAWRWQLGDNPDWAKLDFDDSQWDTLNPTQNINLLKRLPQEGIGWLRIRLQIAPRLRGKPIGLFIRHFGATELFLNGRFMARNGITNPQKQLGQGAYTKTFPFFGLSADSVQLLSIRYSFTRERLLKNRLPFLTVELASSDEAERREQYGELDNLLETLLFGIFLVLGILQLLLFAAATEQRATLYLGLFLLWQSITHLIAVVGENYDLLPKSMGIQKVALIYDSLRISFSVAIALASFFYLLGIYQYFRQPKKVLFFVVAALSLATIPANIVLNTPYDYFSLFLLGFIVPWAEILRVSFMALKQQKIRAKTFTLAHGILLGVFIIYTSGVFVPALQGVLGDYLDILFELSFLGLAFTISLLLAQEQADKNKLLQKQLIELDTLSQKTIAQEQEKQQLLFNQNERLEQQVEARTAELNQSLTELKTTQQQLIQKEKLASLGELTAGIAHEIQNPLNFVNNFSEVSTELIEELKEGPFQKLPDAEKEYADEILGDLSSNLKKINHHGGRASNIVKGMLEHARTESGERRPTDLNALADEYLKIAYHGLRAKDKNFNCELVTDFDSTLEPVDVAPQEIGRVLLNLYNNAFYAVSERANQRSDADYQPKVDVRTQRSESGIEIRVKDNGTGISESVKAKIFQPFFTTKPTGEGTGLGLSLSYDIITRHNGTLSVVSTNGEGAEFTIHLPTHV